VMPNRRAAFLMLPFYPSRTVHAGGPAFEGSLIQGIDEYSLGLAPSLTKVAARPTPKATLTSRGIAYSVAKTLNVNGSPALTKPHSSLARHQRSKQKADRTFEKGTK